MHRTTALALAAVLAAACTPEDEDRCGDGFVWDSEDSTCYPEDTDTDTGTDTGTDTDADASVDDGGPTGLGATCETSEDCTYEIYDFCLVQPGNETGYCTMDDCTASPDDCPAGYQCCLFTVSGVPDFCATEADLELLGAMCEG
jgi:hypothetical protein